MEPTTITAIATAAAFLASEATGVSGLKSNSVIELIVAGFKALFGMKG